jgi:threonyl-tRNA synthetase
MNKLELTKKRHSGAHVLAMAVLEMFPEAKLGVGPDTESGFFYDFQLPRPLIPEDLPILEKKMTAIQSQKLPFVQYSEPIDQAIEFLQKIKQPFKVELAQELKEQGETAVSFYKNSDQFVDLCKGPHVEHTGQIGAFKLTNFSAVYWKGSSDNPTLTRIYALAFANSKDLRLYEKMLEEAKKRDHREIGKKMDLFSFHEEGAGFPFWHNKGMILRNLLIDFWRREHQKAGYQEISTPIILNESLWHQSGHWDNYKENMYFTEIDEQTFSVKPMNCPGGMLVYKEKQHSYRELPLKVGELGLVHRHELSGVLHGLFRVRAFTQDDAHIFCTSQQVEEEVLKVVNLIDKFYRKFGFDYHIELSTRPDKRTGKEEVWDLAESTLEKILKKSGREYAINEGDGAFYGPKLDFHLKDCLGRTWQCGTVQLDFAMPERFELEYVGEDGAKHRPAMLHRVIFGSLERFIGILIEHTAGLLPAWLAPTQVVLLPVADVHEKAAQKTLAKLQAKGIRAELVSSEDSLGKRIRNSEIKRVPLIAIIGDQELEQDSLTIRRPGQKEQKLVSIADFAVKLAKANEEAVSLDL